MIPETIWINLAKETSSYKKFIQDNTSRIGDRISSLFYDLPFEKMRENVR